jgi:outer membrane protein
MNRNASLTLLGCAIALALMPAFAHAEDLLQAYQQARASDPVLAQAEATKLATREGVVQARALLLPSLSASYSYSQSHGTSSSSQPFSTSNGFQVLNFTSSNHSYGTALQGTLSQTLFNFSDWANLKAAHANARSQDATYRSAEQDLYLRVATAYFGVLAAQDQLTYSEANAKALKSQYDQAKQRFDVGLAAITDVNTAKAQYDTAVATVISARNALDDAREALTQITGKPARDLKTLREHIPMNPPAPDNLQAWVDMALSNNPALLASEQQVKSASDSVKAAYGAHLPTLSAQLTYTRNPGWADQNSRLGQAIYNRESAQDVLEQNRRALVRSTRNAFRSVLAGIASVEANKAAVVSSKSSLEATQAGYEVGTQTIVDVLLAQQTLFQSQSAYSQARYNLLLSRLQLAYDAGKLGYQQLQEVNALLQ